MLALAGAGRWEDAVRMLAAADAHAREGWGTQARLLRDCGLPMAKAIFAASIGDARRAADLLRATRGEWRRIGGSRLQRSIFDLLLHGAEHAAAARDAAAASPNSRAA
jgi:hypothetical protein